MTTAGVDLWGTRVAAISYDRARGLGFLEYEPDFVASGIEIAPLHMPLRAGVVYSFPALARDSFAGLPGLVADSLPDRFGNALIDAWLAAQGRDRAGFDPVERLCYIGRRGMGALEFQPAQGPPEHESVPVDVGALVELASAALADRREFTTLLRVRRRGGDALDPATEQAMQTILRVGTSAGGARAKAVIGWNEATGEVRSGQLELPAGFRHWLLKFDGVRGNRGHDDDAELDDPQGYGRIEYAYHLMARAAGITMTDCRLYEENGRAHFMTRRFDRRDDGDKVHMQTLGALEHLDYDLAGTHSYEQAVGVARRLGLPMAAIEELTRRMLFNVVARNQDDHVKNIAFLMDRDGRWSLAPAYDVIHAYNPSGAWTGSHQMTIQGKRDGFTRDDFRAFGRFASLLRGRVDTLLDEVTAAVDRWPEFAERAGIGDETVARIAGTHRSF